MSTMLRVDLMVIVLRIFFPLFVGRLLVSSWASSFNEAIGCECSFVCSERLKFKCLFNVCRWVEFVVLNRPSLSKTPCMPVPLKRNKPNSMECQNSPQLCERENSKMLYYSFACPHFASAHCSLHRAFIYSTRVPAEQQIRKPFRYR